MGVKESLKWKVPIAGAPFPTLASYTAFRKHITNPDDVATNTHYEDKADAHKVYAECLQEARFCWSCTASQSSRGQRGYHEGGMRTFRG